MKRKRAEAEEAEEARPVIEVREGMRCVQPYLFVFRSSAKGRWFGKKLLDVSGLSGSRTDSLAKPYVQ
jgi:hypothetical protein